MPFADRHQLIAAAGHVPAEAGDAVDLLAGGGVVGQFRFAAEGAAEVEHVGAGVLLRVERLSAEGRQQLPHVIATFGHLRRRAASPSSAGGLAAGADSLAAVPASASSPRPARRAPALSVFAAGVCGSAAEAPRLPTRTRAAAKQPKRDTKLDQHRKLSLHACHLQDNAHCAYCGQRRYSGKAFGGSSSLDPHVLPLILTARPWSFRWAGWPSASPDRGGAG